MSDEKDKNIEEYCAICRRPESTCGKLIRMHPQLGVCSDCLQKTFDTFSNGNFQMPGGFTMDMFPFGDAMKFMGGAPMGEEPKNEVVEEVEESDTIEGEPVEGEPEQPEGDNKGKGQKKGPMINFGFIPADFLNGLGMGMPMGQQVKKKKEKKAEMPVLDRQNLPAPHKIKAQLDEFVVGQERAKKAISVAVYNHYKRVVTGTMDDIEIEKSNMLMIGPTGSGKTYLVKTLARLLQVPLAITDATSLTEAGYIGDDVESVLSKLLAAADNDVEKAEQGIVFIDEIDKIAKKRNANQRDVSGESVQQGMLKLLEGAEVEVPVGASSKNAMVPMTTINTKNILFICGGAFPDLDEIIKERLNKAASIGFKSDLKDKYDNDENILQKVTTEDVRKFGMIPEFLGRLPVLFTLEALTEDMLVRILTEPKNAIVKQYQKLLGMDEVKLEFDHEALVSIAKSAKEKKVGARALRSIIEEFMLDIMYEIPKDENIGMVTITKEYVEKTGGPQIQMRGCLAIEEK